MRTTINATMAQSMTDTACIKALVSVGLISMLAVDLALGTARPLTKNCSRIETDPLMLSRLVAEYQVAIRRVNAQFLLQRLENVSASPTEKLGSFSTDKNGRFHQS